MSDRPAGRHLAAALLLAVLAGCGGPADAGGACALQRAGSFPLRLDADMPMLQLTLDGGPAEMILDTGATATMLTQQAADRLGLAQDRTHRFAMTALGGEAPAHAATASLRIAGIALDRQPLVVLPDGLSGFGDPPPDGLLGNDILGRFDVDFDLPHGRVTLYRPRDCPGAVPPWPATRLPRPAAAPAANRLHLRATLDGQELVAFLDSGASVWAVDVRAAARAGVTAPMLAQDPALRSAGIRPGAVAARAHRFGALDFAGTRYPAPTIVVTDLRDAGDMVIGVAFMRHHRIWMSYAAQALFVGPLEALP